ncbi:hypothetical protein [Nocardia brasiliensis]|uniref:hypothetical protein n=1 Tax=Nocardia brasiliensis TaxID=37326 RepID=UPI0024550F36|nr:hypothetical protein [Nocardia brasiliensis]
MENVEVLDAAKRLFEELRAAGVDASFDANPVDRYWEPIVDVKTPGHVYQVWALSIEDSYDVYELTNERQGWADSDTVAGNVDSRHVLALFLGLRAMHEAQARSESENETRCGGAVIEAGVKYAEWITAIRTGRERPGCAEMFAYFAAKDLAVAETCRINNESLAESTPEKLAEIGMSAQPWNPQKLTADQRLFIDERVTSEAVEYLIRIAMPGQPGPQTPTVVSDS